MTKQEKRIKQVISACNHSLCDYAAHISITYKSENVFECVEKMSDAEWTSWTTQPGALRKIYHKLMSMPVNQTAATLIELQFCINIDKQIKQISEMANV
jgi:hypothetical protein